MSATVPRRARLRVHRDLLTMLFDLPPGTAVMGVTASIDADEVVFVLEGSSLPVPPAVECIDLPFVDLVMKRREPRPGEGIPHLEEIRAW